MKSFFLGVLFALPFFALAQGLNQGILSGSFESQTQYYRDDEIIDAIAPDEKIASNNYLKLDYAYKFIQVGVRYEAYLPVLLGYPEGLEGTGIVNRFLTFQKGDLEFTVGNFYDQFGSGIIFRSFEERALGIDNAMDGIRVIYTPINGIELKGIYGTQRDYFEKSDGIIRGLNGEFYLREIFEEAGLPNIHAGLSILSKYEEYTGAEDYDENVKALSYRLSYQGKKISLDAEYATKDIDPTLQNGYNTLRKGRALRLNSSYSQKGLGINLTFRSLENFDFRAEREASLTDSWVNFIPSETRQHGYFAPNIYPYVAQSLGEVGGQLNVNYLFKKNSALGGRYGTKLAINLSEYRSLEQKANPALSLEEYNGKLFRLGDSIFYRDFNIDLKKKINRKLTLTASYIHLEYNQSKIEGRPFDNVISEIVALETLIKFPKRYALRTELQHLWTQQDLKNWLVAGFEFTTPIGLTAFFQSQYNYGNEGKPFYYQVGAAYFHDATRVSASYGRQRGGLICVGGVCRFVPASNGLTLSITTSF